MDYLRAVLQLEAVACKDWLTNKVDRCVGGRVAKQQCAGPLQLPLNNVGVMALDFNGGEGMATAIGHAPLAGLVDPAAGSRIAVVEALTNIVWAPLQDGLRSVSLSANWMWPCRNPGEDARLYRAVEALSDFVVELGINVPTGKDSLSMKQKYPGGREVLSPGTVIVSAGAHCDNIRRVVEPVLRRDGGPIYYVDFSGSPYALGGSSFAQVRNKVGAAAPTVRSAERVRQAFDTLQQLIRAGKILAGHDVASGGLITTLLELCFADLDLGAELDLTEIGEADTLKLLFAENAGVVFQATDNSVEEVLRENKVIFVKLGTASAEATLRLRNGVDEYAFDIAELRQVWYRTSYLLDRKQTTPSLAEARYRNYAEQPLRYTFPTGFAGTLPQRPTGERIKAAIIREKGSNSEREMAHAMYLAGFDVKDVHMTDLIAGRETLDDIRFIGAVGGFSNSDVLGSAKGWAGAFRYNERAREALERFFARPDTLSVGICNGCQLFVELDLINPEHAQKSAMLHNDSAKHESAFTSVVVQKNNSVMLSGLAGTTLGVWISHGEGKFHLPEEESAYNIVAKYGYAGYPANPNGSDYNTAMLGSADGRHLVTMPHIERSIFPWNWAHYPAARAEDAVSPWVQAFVNAREWLEEA
jgi:phosphoribosylformylglycinamidine synthase